MDIKIDVEGQHQFEVSEMILGQNIEAYDRTIPGLMNDRLDNSRFTGPVDPQTGIAQGWQPHGRAMPGLNFELTPGMSMTGIGEAQLIDTHLQRSMGRWQGIVQTGRRIRKGEKLEVEIWAKVRHQPARMRLVVSPLPVLEEAYDMAEIQIDAAYWKCYKKELIVDVDDDEAVFKILVEGDSCVWIDQVHLRPFGEEINLKVFDLISNLKVPSIRFPGGSVSTAYHWKHGIGPGHLRHELFDPVFKHKIRYDFGTDEYLDLCIKQGIRPFITINLGSGTPEEAGDWAAYISNRYISQGLELPETYFMIGNENYGTWESSHMTGEMYVDALCQYAPAIRASHSKAKIIAVGTESSEGLREGESTPWNSLLLDRASDQFDILGFTGYASGKYDDGESISEHIKKGVSHMEQAIQRAVSSLREKGCDHKVCFAEWNMWTRASHWDGLGFYESYDARHALFAASTIHMFIRHGKDIEVANFYGLVNCMGIIQSHGPEQNTSSVYEVFHLYRESLPGDYILDSSQEAGEAVNIICLRKKKKKFLFVINTNSEEEINLNIQNFSVESLTGVILQGESPFRGLNKREIRVNGEVELPPFSITKLSES